MSFRRWRKCVVGLLLLTIIVAVSGCKTLSFYTQAAKGQYQIFAHARSIERLMQEPALAPALKSRFELLERLRAYADKQLELPVDGHYLKYADLHRPYVVWNVEAAPEFSMQPKTWWYPLVGSLEYRGYFSRPGATNYAGFLRKKGYDVSVGGVSAYSTLGWFKDPVLNTFLFEPDSELAETIFHELAHQRVFARGDTDFNEAFATTVGQEGTRRFFRASGAEQALSEYLAHLERNRHFVQLVMKTRARLEALYGDVRDDKGKVKATPKNKGVPAQQLRTEKEKILAEMKQQFETLRVNWGPDVDFDGWFTHPINNAHLNSVAAYYDLVPAFENLLALNGGDLGKFYSAAERLSRMSKEKREEWLRSLGSKNGNGLLSHLQQKAPAALP